MLRTIKAAAAVVLACGLFAGGAQATAINGSVTVSDGLTASGFLPCSSISIVGDCTSIQPHGNGNTSGSTGDFLAPIDQDGSLNATVLAWVFANPGATNNEVCTPNFCFDIMNAIVQPHSPVHCVGSSCSDALTILIDGVVTGAGFDPTIFTGSLALTGSCTLGTNGQQCQTGTASGGYTYSLSATGQPFQTPEPGTLALLGIAFLGIGAARRRMR